MEIVLTKTLVETLPKLSANWVSNNKHNISSPVIILEGKNLWNIKFIFFLFNPFLAAGLLL